MVKIAEGTEFFILKTGAEIPEHKKPETQEEADELEKAGFVITKYVFLEEDDPRFAVTGYFEKVEQES